MEPTAPTTAYPTAPDGGAVFLENYALAGERQYVEAGGLPVSDTL